MKVIHRPLSSVALEPAHGGTGFRRLYAASGDLQSEGFEAFAYGFLPAGASFDWHNHADVDELMLVISGQGVVTDRDGEYEYAPGDSFIFPANVDHAIRNTSAVDHEYIFVRVHI